MDEPIFNSVEGGYGPSSESANTKVAFKRGNIANLPTEIAEGTFYVTIDERAMYIDVSPSHRIRIGDFQEFATLTDLQATTNPSTTALYYVTELNCLAKWDGEKYIQINIDTGMIGVEVVGDGNAVTAAAYDPATRKLTLTASATYTTANDVESQIDGKIGELKIGEDRCNTVKEYIDKKTNGIVTDADFDGLTGRVTAAENKLDKLNSNVDTDGSVAKTVNDAIVALDLANTYEAKGSKDADIAAAKKSGDDAQAAVNMLAGDDTGKSARTIANEELAKQLIPENATESLDTLAEIAAWIQEHPRSASNMNKAIKDLKTLIGTLPEDAASETIVAYIQEYANAAISALSIGDYAKAVDLAAAVSRIAIVERNSHEHGNKDVLDAVTEEKVSAWDNAEKNAKAYTDSAMTWGTF